MMIAWLDEVGSKDVESVGGKGAQLGEMTRAGFPVPPGFCVTSQAYRAQIRSGALVGAIESLFAEGSGDGDLADRSAEARRRIEAQDILPELEADIEAAYERLRERGFGRVAVRSSATAEDLPDASFAGQQETFLSIQGAAAVLQAVRSCWASLWTERACAYRTKMGYDHGSVALAVVVQAMVESDTSGVLFTVDPLAPENGAMLINASYGLGESVVSGKVSPDSYLVSKGIGLRVAKRRLGSKESFIRSLPGCATETLPTPPEKRSVFCLRNKELSVLKRLGLAVESHYGSPQDIEWAFEGGRLFLLQARPITATGAMAGQAADAPGGYERKRISASARKLIDSLHEHCPDAILPLEFDGIVSLQQQKSDIMGALGLLVPQAATILSLDPDGIVEAKPFSTRPALRILAFPLLTRKFLSTFTSEWAAEGSRGLMARREAIRAMDPELQYDDALASIIEEFFRIVDGQCAIRFRAHLFPMMLIGKLLRLRMKLAGLPRDTTELDLLGGLQYKSSEIEGELYGLAEAAESSPSVKELLIGTASDKVLESLGSAEGGDEFLAKLMDFLSRHGARTTKTFQPFSSHSWAERPGDLIASLGAIVRSGGASKRNAMIEKSAAKAKWIEEATGTSAFGGIGFRRSLAQYRDCFVARELGLYEIEESYVVLRALVAEAGKRLAKRGLFPDGDDIRFARSAELVEALRGKQGADFATLVARRKAGRPGAIVAWDGAELGEPSGGGLSGAPSSAGVFEGPARIVLGPDDFSKMRSGDVLVCPYTDPTWTPLFSLSGAIVAESGGPLSHAAIVAREYSIPAVMGVSGALSALKDGQMVRVDGSRGRVYSL